MHACMHERIYVSLISALSHETTFIPYRLHPPSTPPSRKVVVRNSESPMATTSNSAAKWTETRTDDGAKATLNLSSISRRYRRITMKYRHRLKGRSANRRFAKGKRFTCN
ncbi:unnamed protein product [Onchocerca flexuosa]|uniref:Secreted protein n=1 Tax=Onchocerca flexuosa TaxID=387005 RepID=A0A183I7R5_9BILA|nr:unnamed protein product [Onchocerca flexuosa]